MTIEQNGFRGLGIAPGLLEIIDKLKFTVPTPIQHKAIPVAIEGKDIIGIAQTGTGKTMAFGIPMIQRLAQSKDKGLVLVPTRELAAQVNDAISKLTPAFGMKTALVIGGESMRNQILRLRQNPKIIIATPGRLNDHISQRLVNLKDVRILVLDEADRMLDMGFLPQIESILKQVPKERQTMLFSATMPAAIVRIASMHMSLPVRTEIAPSGTAPTEVTQELYVVKKESKGAVLGQILTEYKGSVLLFVRTRIAAMKVTRLLRAMKFSVAEIHSDRSQGQRKDALAGFKSGQYRILVATDIASRGIDVTGIELVINYDLPDEAENYVHRIERTGRAGMSGMAITLATPEQRKEVKKIEEIIRGSIPMAQNEKIPVEEFLAPAKNVVRSFFPTGRRRSSRRVFTRR